MKVFAVTLIGFISFGCAIQPGNQIFKIRHGVGQMPASEELNYAISFGRRCSPPDANGQVFGSDIWFHVVPKAGGSSNLRASRAYCIASKNRFASSK